MIMPTRPRTGHELAPSIPSFSSRGPYLLTRSILKVINLKLSVSLTVFFFLVIMLNSYQFIVHSGLINSMRNLLQPDIAAPGVNILASWLIGDLNAAPQGKEPPLVNIESGTSMSCPHVSGIAARLKSENPSWSPAAIRSAIMTTGKNTVRDYRINHNH